MQTRRYPRTLEEAFGPHTSRHIDEAPARMPALHWLVASVVAVVCTVVIAACGAPQ